MLKLKDILKEDVKVKETDVDGRIYNWKEEMEKGKFDPENPTVHLLGYGTATYKSLLKNTASDLVSIANELKKGNVKKAHNKLINDYGNIVLYKVKCLNDVRKELQTSVWKRKITMYKNKKKYGLVKRHNVCSQYLRYRSQYRKYGGF